MFIKEKIKRQTLTTNKNKVWCDKYSSKLNRIESDLPVVEFYDGSKVFYKNNYPHEIEITREDMEMLAACLILELNLVIALNGLTVCFNRESKKGQVIILDLEKHFQIKFTTQKKELITEKIKKNIFKLNTTFDGYSDLSLHISKDIQNYEQQKQLSFKTIEKFIWNKIYREY